MAASCTEQTVLGFRRLKDLAAPKSNSDFARIVKKQSSNVSSYLNGTIIPSGKLLVEMSQHAFKEVFEWQVQPIIELEPIAKGLKALSTKAGIYSLYDSSGSVIYVGQASNLRIEVNRTLARKMTFPIRRAPNLGNKTHRVYKDVTHYMSAYQITSARVRHNLEALLLRMYPNQSHNNKMGIFR